MKNMLVNWWSSFRKEPFITFLFIFQLAVSAFVLFSAAFEVKYSYDKYTSVNTAYTNYYFYRFDFNFGSMFHIGEPYSGSNKNGFVEKNGFRN